MCFSKYLWSQRSDCEGPGVSFCRALDVVTPRRRRRKKEGEDGCVGKQLLCRESTRSATEVSPQPYNGKWGAAELPFNLLGLVPGLKSYCHWNRTFSWKFCRSLRIHLLSSLCVWEVFCSGLLFRDWSSSLSLSGGRTHTFLHSEREALWVCVWTKWPSVGWLCSDCLYVGAWSGDTWSPPHIQAGGRKKTLRVCVFVQTAAEVGEGGESVGGRGRWSDAPGVCVCVQQQTRLQNLELRNFLHGWRWTVIMERAVLWVRPVTFVSG